MESETVVLANQGLYKQTERVAQICLASQLGGLCDFRVQAANTNLKARLLKKATQPCDIGKVKTVAGVVFGNKKDPCNVWAMGFNTDHKGLNCNRKSRLIEVIEPTGKEVGVHWGEFEAGIA